MLKIRQSRTLLRQWIAFCTTFRESDVTHAVDIGLSFMLGNESISMWVPCQHSLCVNTLQIWEHCELNENNINTQVSWNHEVPIYKAETNSTSYGRKKSFKMTLGLLQQHFITKGTFSPPPPHPYITHDLPSICSRQGCLCAELSLPDHAPSPGLHRETAEWNSRSSGPTAQVPVGVKWDLRDLILRFLIGCKGCSEYSEFSCLVSIVSL